MSATSHLKSRLQADKDGDSSLFTLTGILSGFSIAGVLALMVMDLTKRPILIMFIAFIISSILFIISTLVTYQIMESITAIIRYLQSSDQSVELAYRGTPRTIAYITFAAGLFAMLVALATVGFLHSWWLGIVITLLIVLGIGAVLFSVSRLQLDSAFFPDE